MTAAGKRNVGLLVAGVVVFALSLAAGAVFAFDLNQYLTVEELWENDELLSPEARRFGVGMIQRAALKRMTLFGPLFAGLGVVGVVFLARGLRKK